MPSHSVKQAKVMSAIAHGWHPSEGSVAKIPKKVAVEFHDADAGHKYGHGTDKKAKALHATKHYRKKKARGGGVEGDGKDDTSYGGTLPRSIQPMTTQIPESWTRLPPNPAPKYAEGGDTLDDADQAAMMPETYVNPLAKQMVGRTASLPQRLIDEASQSTPGLRREDYTDNPYAPQPNQGLYDTAGETAMQAAGNAGVRPAPGVSGVFVGPYGAHMLRAEDRAAMVPHPVAAQDIAERARNLRPEFKDIYKGAAQDMRDANARFTLEARQASANPKDADVFANSGWSRGAEGMPRKEIPDIGAKLVPLEGTDNFVIQHPAGDLHKIYDIPPISFNRNIRTGDARIFTDTNKIELGGEPTKANLKASVGPVLHEIQHAIQNKEGFSPGSNPLLETGSTEFAKSLGHSGPKAGSIQRAQMGIEFGIPSTESSIAFDNYRRRSGEVEAENVSDRRAKSFRYLIHPEHTEKYGRGVQLPQDVRDSLIPEARKALGRASGGKIDNFNPERGAAFGLARQGMIQSSVPGRTDKLNMNVPSGSYIIPADIPGAIGQGNSVAGGSILDKMFKKGPYGMNIAKAQGPRIGTRHSSLSAMHFAKGGPVGKVTPIVAAGGEYVVHPGTVAAMGHGDIDLGHKILDAFVKHVRSKHITTLRGLKPPKGSK